MMERMSGVQEFAITPFFRALPQLKLAVCNVDKKGNQSRVQKIPAEGIVLSRGLDEM